MDELSKTTLAVFYFIFAFSALNLAIIAYRLGQIHLTLKRIVSRWAALENLGLFEEDELDIIGTQQRATEEAMRMHD